MIHPHTRLVFIDEVVGNGVIATRRIPRGTITWVLDGLDRSFTDTDLSALPPCYNHLIDRWTFHDGHGRRVLCWDHGRNLNHSCAPNCGGSEFLFEIALRDIEEGEQLTNDYATLYMHAGESFVCRCGAPGCRGRASNEHQSTVVAAIHEQLGDALGIMELVEQPLGPFMCQDWLETALDSITLGLRNATAVRK